MTLIIDYRNSSFVVNLQ